MAITIKNNCAIRQVSKHHHGQRPNQQHRSTEALKENSWPAIKTESNPTRYFPPCYRWSGDFAN